jgi:hypothetical protein
MLPDQNPVDLADAVRKPKPQVWRFPKPPLETGATSVGRPLKTRKRLSAKQRSTP